MKKSSRKPISFDDPRFYLNREISWLEFNSRVLEEGRSEETPLLEKIKFLSIFSSNLDEFFMIRVAGLKKVLKEGFRTFDGPDQLPAKEVLRLINSKTKHQLADQYKLFDQVMKDLAKNGITRRKVSDLSSAQKQSLDQYFLNNIFPILTPLAVDPAHPFPNLTNLSLYIVVVFSSAGVQKQNDAAPIAFVEVPNVLPRLVEVVNHEDEYEFVVLEELIVKNLEYIFPGFQIQNYFFLRATHNLDYTFLENEVVDLLKSVESKIGDRSSRETVRLELFGKPPEFLLRMLLEQLNLSPHDVYELDGPLVLNNFLALHSLPFDHLKDRPFNPRITSVMKKTEDIFSLIRKEDILLHHPYDSFYSTVEFIWAAALDPDVLAIKQTLYRSSGNSPIIEALIRAAEEGKQVTAVVELKARFDEKNNIVWARRMEAAGVNVVFGFVGIKTHCKITLVVRKEENGLRRYTHLSTGNYNTVTAAIFVDLGFLTCDEKIGGDANVIFNLLTGFNILTDDRRLATAAKLPVLSKLTIAPLNLREKILGLIQGEIDFHKKSGKGRIIAKLNALADQDIIGKLYEASGHGVKISLIVRGICCLRPKMKGASENITVVSILDRFLEHSRVFYFHAGGEEKVFLSSADWMKRNMDRRIEVIWPIEKKSLKQRIINEILQLYLSDNTKARELNPNGVYDRLKTEGDEEPIRVQQELIERAREEGIKSIPYSKAMSQVPSKGARRSVAITQRKKT